MEIYEKIRHLHEHEGKSQRSIAKILGISRNTVKKYFDGSHVPWQRQGVSGRQRYVVTEQVLEFILDCLACDEAENVKKQRHTAKRIYDRLVEEKNFKGGETTIREIVAQLRSKQAKAFIPLAYDPGEAIQIDWGEATVYLQGQKKKVHIFCMRECYSADMYCKAFYRPNEESFLEGQISGLDYYEGAPKRMIFDNAKVAVKEGFGLHAKVQDRYKALAAHYAFQCDFCNIAAGHEKGLVEGLVGWVRRNILVPIPRVENIDELNQLLLQRCLQYRKHKIKEREQNVGEMATTSKTRMIPLPGYRFDSSKCITARVGDFSTVRFDYNHYSVPFRYVNKEITIKGYGNEVVMVYRNAEIARYTRSYERGKTLYRLEHYIDLIEQRPRSVFNAKPVKSNITAELLEIGRRLSGPREMVKLLRLCMDYGEPQVMEAIRSIKGSVFTIEQIQSHLQSNTLQVGKISSPVEIHVTPPQFNKYDALINRGAVV